MFVAKVKRVANPRKTTVKKKKAKKTVVTRRKTKNKAKRNPVALLTLGLAGNPRKKNNRMATKTKRKNPKRSAAAKKAARTRKRNLTMKAAAPKRRKTNPKRYAKRTKKRNSTRVIVMAPKRNGRRGKRNPQMFGMTMNAGQAAKMVAAGLVGVTATKLIVPQLPAQIISTPVGAAVASIAVAIAGGWLVGKWDSTMGSAFAFGGLMQAGSIVLNAVPIPGASQFALAGGRGMGTFVPGSYPVPQIPVVTTGATGVGGAAGRPAGNRAYPRPYSS